VETLQYFGLKESEVTLLFIQASSARYIKPTEPDQILPWLKEYTVSPNFDATSLIFCLPCIHILIK